MTALLPASTYDVEAVRADFPVLSRQVNGRPLVYLDNACSSHKPRQVLDAERDFVEQHYSNVHRGVHTLSQEATDAYEAARDHRRARSSARPTPHEVVFTKNATEAYNLVAYSFGNAAAGSRFAIGPGDEVCVTEMEHHSNLVPWQMLCERTGATLRWIPLTDDGRLDLTDLDALVNERTKVLAFVHVSNILGTANPVELLVARAREVGALRAARRRAVGAAPGRSTCRRSASTSSSPPATRCWRPSGIGVLWGRRELLDAMPPFMGGGSMIEVVQMGGSTYAPAPERFEAGTPVISQAVALAAACDYLHEVGLDRITAHEQALTARLLEGLAPPRRRAGHRPRLDARRAARPCRSRSRACTRTTSASRSTTSASPCGSATTAPRRSAAATACRPRRARRRTSTTPRPRSTRCWKASRPSSVSGGDMTTPTRPSRCTRRSSWTTTATPTTRGCATRTTSRSTTSTRPAATR